MTRCPTAREWTALFGQLAAISNEHDDGPGYSGMLTLAKRAGIDYRALEDATYDEGKRICAQDAHLDLTDASNAPAVAVATVGLQMGVLAGIAVASGEDSSALRSAIRNVSRRICDELDADHARTSPLLLAALKNQLDKALADG